MGLPFFFHRVASDDAPPSSSTRRKRLFAESENDRDQFPVRSPPCFNTAFVAPHNEPPDLYALFDLDAERRTFLFNSFDHLQA